LIDADNKVLDSDSLKIKRKIMLDGSVNFFAEVNFKNEEKKAKLVFESSNKKVFEVNVKIMGKTACEKTFKPVCGQFGIDVKCIVGPCPPSLVIETFSNKCMSVLKNAKVLYEGQCNPERQQEGSAKYSEENVKKDLLVKREGIIQKKSEELFSKFDLYTLKLESVISKIEPKIIKKNIKDATSLLKVIKSDLFLAKNQTAKARIIFSSIPKKENKEEVQKNLVDVKNILESSKAILKNIFSNLKIVVTKIK
jgi:hypothetical protein